MLKKSVILIILNYLLHSNCAPSYIEIGRENHKSEIVRSSQKLFVMTKNGRKHEIIQFEFTETHLIGEEILALKPKYLSKKIKINLADIVSVKVENPEFKKKRNPLIIILGGAIFGMLIVVLIDHLSNKYP